METQTTLDNLATALTALVPANLTEFVTVEASDYLSPSVDIRFCHTRSESRLDRLNAPNMFITVRPVRDGKLEAKSVAHCHKLRDADAPKMRKRTATAEKVAQHIANYFGKNEAALLSAGPYVGR